jgi:hypothetical protein
VCLHFSYPKKKKFIVTFLLPINSFFFYLSHIVNYVEGFFFSFHMLYGIKLEGIIKRLYKIKLKGSNLLYVIKDLLLSTNLLYIIKDLFSTNLLINELSLK